MRINDWIYQNCRFAQEQVAVKPQEDESEVQAAERAHNLAISTNRSVTLVFDSGTVDISPSDLMFFHRGTVKESWVYKNCKFAQSIKPYDSQFPRAGGVVDGRTVLNGPVPNTSSISASLLDYTVLPGIREVSMSHFSVPKSVFYADDDYKKSERLAEQIRQSNTIAPLIIVVDKDGPYILEGGHRYVALYYLGAKSFPALVVLDDESLIENTPTENITK